MWPDVEDVPPGDFEALLPQVLQRGHELRRVARRQRQASWLGRASAVLVVAGLAAVTARATQEPTVRTERDVVAAPAVDDDGTTSSPSSTIAADGSSSTTPSTRGERGPDDGDDDDPSSTTTDGPRRTAPTVVVEQRGHDGLYRTAVLLPGSSRLVPITAASADRQMPVVSPTGDAVAFQRLQPHPLTGQDRWEVFVVGTDGTGLKQITGGLLEGGPAVLEPPLGPGSRWPTWSPDGRRLAFSCTGPTGLAQICISRSDGSGKRPITLEGQGYYQPTWSPDGKTIAAKRELTPGLIDLWLITPDGGSPVALPLPALDPRGVRLSWLADGLTLVYSRLEPSPATLMAIDVTTGVQRAIPTSGPARFPIACGKDQVLYLQSATAADDPGLRTGPLVLTGLDGTAPSQILGALDDQEHLPSSCAKF